MDRNKPQPSKRIILLLALVLLALLLVLLFLVFLFPGSIPETLETYFLTVPTVPPTPSPTRIDLYTYYNFRETQQIPVYDHREDRLIVMDFESYIIGVVGAEMPVAYETEALRAQAVAARTYAFRKILRGGCATYEGAACCTNSKCCQAFISDARMQERWGDAAGMNYNRIADAVMSTAGEVLVYNGAIADAMFHACSGGHTEDSENVYANALPYLRGVESLYEDPMRTQTVEVSFEEAVDKIRASYPDAHVTSENIRSSIELVEFFDTGRVKTVRLGDITIVGKKLRNVFDLQSAMFTMDTTAAGFVFHVKGYGHGVGLSQNGANGYAKHGYTYDQILKHYYTGVEIAKDLNGMATVIENAAPEVTPSHG